MALVTSISLKVTAALTGAGDFATPRSDLSYEKIIALASGVGAGQADKIFHDQRTLVASATEDLDFAGALTDPLGATVIFARIKAVIFYAALANTNNVVVTRPASNGLLLFTAVSAGVSLSPGGFFAFSVRDASAIPVTAGTADLLTITNSAGGTSVVYDVIIVGASA
jgi:hypothetical protein